MKVTVALLFMSGFCGLVLQTAWLRRLGLVFGTSTSASAAVVAIFMGGLGLGSALLGRRVDRVSNPLRFYAILEVIVALSAAASPWLIGGAASAYVAMGGQSSLGAWGATIMRLALAALVLAAPTLAMGGTLPAAVRAVTTADDRYRTRAAILYGINTLGAVVGASLSTFVLLPAYGTRTTVWLATAMLLGVAIVAWRLSGRLVTASEDVSPQEARRITDEPEPRSGGPKTGLSLSALGRIAETPPPWMVYLAAGIVGFAFFLMELVWYRMLGPILGGTTYTFGLILAVALLGIGLGGAAYAVLFRRLVPSLSAFAATCSLEAAFIALPFAAGDRLALLAAQYREAATGFGDQVFGWAIVAMLVILPAAFVSGVQFPLLLALAGRGTKDVGRQVGFTLACNTTGAIVGSLAGGFGLLPLLTAPGAWIAVVAILVALGLGAVALAVRGGAIGRGWITPVGAAAVAALCLFANGPTAAWRHSGIGAHRFKLPKGGPNEVQNWLNAMRRRIVWEAEGVEASVGLENSSGLSFFINGKCDGHVTGDVGTQMVSGVLAAMLHPEPKTSLIIGLGTGETPGWLAEVDSIKRVDVVELEPAVDEMARRCAPVNHDVLRHKKVRMIYNDAREVLLTTPDHYDLIFSEPSNPYRAGIANLFTREFYRSCRDRLNDDGLFVQWVQGYEIDEKTVHTAFSTVRSVFDHVEVWQSKHEDMLLICSRQPIEHPVDRLRQRLRQEPYRSAMAFGWNVAEVEGLLARFVVGPKVVDQIALEQQGVLNTDDHNLIEYGFARTVGQTTGFSIARLRERAVALGAHRPAVVHADDLDWNRVDGHRQLFYGLSEQFLSLDPNDPELTARGEVLRRYWAGDMKGMTETWEKAGYKPMFPVETALLGLAYADLGDQRAKQFTVPLRDYQAVEADAIDAYLAMRQGNLVESSALLERVFVQLRDCPWGLTHTIEIAFSTATAVAQADPTLAPRLFAALERPFAVHAYGDARRSTVLDLAMMIGGRRLLDVVETYEPNILWDGTFLETRRAVYQQAGHPRAGQAKEDLDAFARNKSKRPVDRKP